MERGSNVKASESNQVHQLHANCCIAILVVLWVGCHPFAHKETKAISYIWQIPDDSVCDSVISTY